MAVKNSSRKKKTITENQTDMDHYQKVIWI